MKTLVVALLFIVLGCSMISCAPGPASDPVKPEKVFTPPGKDPIHALALSESGEFIAVGRFDGTSALLDRQGKVLKSWPSAKGSWVTLCAVNERLGLVVSGSGSDDVSVLQTGDYRVAATQQLGNSASTVAFHPKEPVALIGTDVLRDREGLVRRYDIDKKRWDDILDTKKVAGVKVEEPGVYGLEFSPDGTHLAVLTRSTVLLLDWKSQKVVHTIAQQGKQLYQSLHFSHDGKRLVLSDHNRTFWVYDTTTWVGQAVVIPDDQQMGRFCVTRDDKHICAAIATPAGRSQGCWAVYSFPDIKPLAYVPAHEGVITHIVADPKENKVLTGGADGKIMLWSLDEVLKPKK